MDGHNYPSIPLMKISAFHKMQGDYVEWYSPMFSGHMDKVYMSKVFSFTPDYQYCIDADEIIKGGTGFCIRLVNGKEVYDKFKDKQLPREIEHIYPDYSIYYDRLPQVKSTAYGYMSRGCPRGCNFCHIKDKEGTCSIKVADLSEFWNGQKFISLCDANTLACRDYKDILWQLIDSKAYVDFNQGVDIRLMTDEKAEMIKRIKTKVIHFAWDNYNDWNVIVPNLKAFKEITGWDKRKTQVFMLTNFDTTHEQDLERVYKLRDLGYWPYVMIYDKEHAPLKARQLQRFVNNRWIFETEKNFENYNKY